MNFGFIQTAECVNTVAPVDPRCADPAFAATHPDICPAGVTPHLVIKPSVALACALGSVQFSAFVVSNGQETDVTSQAVFSTSNPEIAIIGAGSGNCTGLSQGDVTVSASYQGQTATARMTVIGTTGDCCSQQHVAMTVLVDNSRSMSQAFSGDYATRLDFAKAAATRFITEVNTTKDLIGLFSFNGYSYSDLSVPTSDAAAVAALVPSISPTAQLTEFYTALTAAIADLNATTSDLKVIVLITDGEDTSPEAGDGYQSGSDPVELLAEFKNQGGIVICLGCRASGSGFAFLSALATGGFFINSYPDLESDSLNFLSGLKGYICAGNCTPAGDVMVATPQLDYDDFTNWNITGGKVDLIGPGLFDFLPGNGLYVDLAGSTSPYYGRMVTKSSFAVTAGTEYRLSLELAGNQRLDDSPYSALLKVFYIQGGVETPILSQVVTINAYRQGFTQYSFGFTAPATGSVQISVQQQEVPVDVAGIERAFGLLLGSVDFKNETDLVTLFYDNFDTENIQYVPPRCGAGTTLIYGAYQYGYNCYGTGCLDSPPPQQLPDPNPLPDLESGYTPPTLYSSSKTVCVQCPTGSTFLLTAPLAFTYVSSTTGPPYQSVVRLTSAAIVQYLQWDASYGILYWSSLLVEGSNDGTNWTTLWGPTDFGGTGIFRLYLAGNTTAYRYYRMTFSPTGGTPAYTPPFIAFHTMYSPAAATQFCATGTGNGYSQAQADTAATEAAQTAAEALRDAAGVCALLYTSTRSYTDQCPYGNSPDITETATAYSLNNQAEADALAGAAAKAAAVAARTASGGCIGSNNEQHMTINDGVPGQARGATPYPSVKSVSTFGAGATVSHVTVSITGFTHTWPSDVDMILEAPDGTTCRLYGGCGDGFAVSGIDLLFDDSGAALPNTQIASGTYRPTQTDIELNAPVPGPAGPYGSTLSVFNGVLANGLWTLWVFDRSPGNTGSISGWDLTIT